VRGFSSPYDLGSVMHYGGYSFSSNSLPSLVDKTNNNPINAQRVGLSQEDLIEINALYLCPHATDTTGKQGLLSCCIVYCRLVLLHFLLLS